MQQTVISMAILKINLTEDMLKLISNLTFTEVPNLEEEKDKVTWGFDFFNLYGGTDVTFENIAYILGIYDKHIPGTEESPLGAQFPKEVEDYIWDIHTNILEHIGWIEELVHQFCARGGLKPGVYKCKAHEHIWERED